MEPGTQPSVSYGYDDGYTGAPVAGAVLATIFFPLIALIAALIFQGSETSPRKKSQLKMWAWISGGWLAFGLLITLLAFIAFGVLAATTIGHVGDLHAPPGPRIHQSAPCRGGPDNNAIATPIPGTDKYIFPCKLGGTTTVVISGIPRP